jgi:YD repeat-containing protein
MSYVGTGGLLGTFQKPTGDLSTFTYVGDQLRKNEHSGGRWATIGGGATYDGFNGISYETRLGKEIIYIDLSPGRNYSGFGRSKVQSNVGTVMFHKSATNISEDWGYYSVSSQVVEDSRFKDHIRNPTSTYQDRMGLAKNDYFTETSTLTDPENPWSISALTKTSSFYDSAASYAERITTTSFNPTTRTWTTTSPMGRTSTSILDTDERVTSFRNGNLHPYTFTYEMDQVKTVSQTTNRVTTYNYNPTTRLLASVVNPLNQSTYFSYDDNEQLIAQTFPDLKIVQYSYDDLGRLTGVTPPSRPQHSFTFNSQEQMGSYLAPSQTQGTNYSYDFDNRITSITKPSGAVLTFDYDPIYHFLNQIVSPSSTITYTRSAPTWNPTTIANSGGFYINQTFTGQALSTQSLSDSALNFLGSMQTNYNDRGSIAS